MNIAVLGSNCKFSSDLAVQLNQLKKSSLVYRYDILSNFKKDVPLYKSLLDSIGEIPTTFEVVEGQVEEVRQQKNKSPLGEYIGDVETRFLNISSENKNTEKLKTLESIFKVLNTKTDTSSSYIEECAIKKLNDSKKSELLISNTLNIINVYSGIMNTSILNLLINKDPLTIIIKVENNSCFLPCEVTEKDLEDITKRNPQSMVLKVVSLNELLKNNFFISTFNLKNEKVKEVVIEKEKPLTDLHVFNGPLIAHVNHDLDLAMRLQLEQIVQAARAA